MIVFKIKDGSNASLTPIGVYPLLKFNPFFKNEEKLETALAVLTHIALRNHHNVDEEHIETPTPIHSFKLAELCGRRLYSDIIEQLEKLKIITIDKIYTVGLSSRGYKINEPFSNQSFRARRYRNVKVISRLEKMKNNEIQDEDSITIALRNRMSRIFIDEKRALRMALEMCTCVSDECVCIDFKKLEYYKNRIMSINHTSSNAHISQTNGRFFDKEINLPRVFREFLYIEYEEDGVKCQKFNKIEMDAKNSQLAILAIMAMREEADIEQSFIDDSLQGTIYDKAAEYLGIHRNDVKPFFVANLLYKADNAMYLLRSKKPEDALIKRFLVYFKETYPKFEAWLLNKKKELALDDSIPTNNEKNKGASRLAIIVQQVESHFWIQTFSKNIIDEKGDEFTFFPIHDSVLLFNPTEDDVVELRNRLDEIAIEQFDNKITIGKKEYDDIDEIVDNSNSQEAFHEYANILMLLILEKMMK